MHTITDKEAFYRSLSEVVTLLTHEDYQQLAPAESDTPQTIAWLAYQFDPKNVDAPIQNPEIVVNVDQFRVPGLSAHLVQTMIEIVVRHEVSELWHSIQPEQRTQRRHTPESGSALPHQLALMEEWQLAFELGAHDEYMRCIEHWAAHITIEQGEAAGKQFLHENKAAYLQIQSALTAVR